MNELWKIALDDLRAKISGDSFETWFGSILFEKVEGDVLYVRIPNRFYADWITTHYLPIIQSTLCTKVREAKWSIHWEVDENLREAAEEKQKKSVPPPRSFRLIQSERPPQTETERGSIPTSQIRPFKSPAGDDANRPLNPKYRFDNFVVGPSNELAHAASLAASKTPGSRYNPLFIYGGVGLGKTHLVNAIGHAIVQENPEARIAYVSAERFTNEFIWALQNQRINDFRQRYRQNCDVLLMDDIQFLAGRVQTQEEFFHTFNSLYHADKQIVVTSDVVPERISEMEERLISRFQWGMVADVQAPELDTRIAILRKKAEQENIELSDEVALFLAQNVRSNVRELEGTLIRIAVRAELTRRPVNMEFCRDTLRIVPSEQSSKASVEDIQRAVCAYFNIRLTELKSQKRNRSISFPRMVAMYVCRQRLGTSYPEIGDRFGGKDHTTVMSAVRRIGALIETEPSVKNTLDAIERKIGI